MFTVIETPTFSRLVADYWTAEEREAFAAWIARNPEEGDVIPGAGGCRKVRWGRQGRGKRGGVRVIYFNRLDYGEIWLLVIYAKSETDDIPAHVLKQVKAEIENG